MRKRTIFLDPQKLPVHFYYMWNLNSDVLKAQQKYKQGYLSRNPTKKTADKTTYPV